MAVGPSEEKALEPGQAAVRAAEEVNAAEGASGLVFGLVIRGGYRLLRRPWWHPRRFRRSR
jgi:hypothetical protein